MKKYYILASATISIIIGIILIFPKPLVNEEEIESFWSNKTHATSKFDLISCGDSRVYRGISSDILSEIDSKLSYINLGYSSAGLSDSYLDFVTSKFLPKSKNKILVVGLSPHSLTQEAKRNESLNSYFGISGFNKFRYRYLSPILKYFTIYKPTDLIEIEKNTYLQEFNNDGWVASDKIFPDSTHALASYRKTFSAYKTTKKDMVSTIDKLKKIAATDITVVAFRVPTTKQMELLEDSMSGFEEDYIKTELIKHSVIWLDFTNSQFVSYDGSHLNESSARKLSRLIGREISKRYLIK